MWPRHTGDFSVFRIYAGKDNRPADYSSENVPYEAEKYLKVSTKGYKEGDFAMIMGFPGSTQRYMTSYEIDYMLSVDNPQRIFIRGERQEILKKDMAASDEVRIKYASKYAGSSNYWKNSIGMSRGIERLGVKAKKQAQEESFQSWAERNTLPEERYSQALSMIRRATEDAAVPSAARQYVMEALYRAVEIISPALVVGNAPDSLDEAYKARYEEYIAGFYKDYSLPTDRKVAYRMFEITQQNCKDLPSVFADVIDAQFGGDTRAYVDYLYDNSVFCTEEGARKALADGKASVAADPAVVLAQSVYAKASELGKKAEAARAMAAEGKRLYIAGLMMQHPDRMWASDANFTMRLTYGNVLPYDPADGVKYDYYTTLKGVMEKEDPNNPVEFTVPERLKEIYAARDYGRYADRNGELPTCFLANCDITGGNSGSPIMNARGELIGLAFDGNWEAMSGDVAFEPELQRTISVDIRYVLLVIDKFAGCTRLIDEMDIK
ncbi:MAG: S46 family peptidase, partial [Alistipes sp.]|nr:S46 family peptidase [Alistipes sp.]